MPVRIAVDARLADYQPAGITTYTRALLEEMPEVAEDMEFVALRSRKARARLVANARVRERRLLMPPHHRWEQLALPLELAPLRPDLVHSPDFIPCFHRRWRAVVTVHDLAFLRYPFLLTEESSRYYGQVGRACASAERVIAVSHSTARDIENLLGVGAERVCVVHEAADPIFRPLDRNEAKEAVARHLGWSGEYLLFVSTIEPRKNLETLLKALAMLRGAEASQSRIHSLRLVVAGRRGWLYEGVQVLVEQLGLTKTVVFSGPASREELVNLYNAALALVYPSLYEGFGLPPLEAMACGTPVLCADTSSLPEVVGDAGILLPPLDVEAWADALRRVVEDEELRARLSARGLQRARAFSWRRAAVETVAVYREALGLKA